MKSVGNAELLSVGALGGQSFDHLQHGMLLAGDHGLLRPVDGGNRDDVAELCQRLPHSRLSSLHGKHAAALRQVLHQPASGCDQLQAIFPGKHAGGASSGELTHAVSQHEVRFDAPRRPQLIKSILDREQGRLSERGLMQLLFPGRIFVEHGQQGLWQVIAENLIAGIQRLAKGRLAFVQRPSHPQVLRSLAGKQEGDLGAILLTQRLLRSCGGELLPACFRVVGHDRQAVMEVGAACGGGKADIGQRIGTIGQIFVVAAGEFLQGRLVLCREDQEVLGAVRGEIPPGRFGCLFQDDMGVGAAEAEGTDPCDPPALDGRPGGTLGGNGQGEFLPGNERIGVVQVQVGRDFAVLQRQNDLDQAGDPRGGFQVPQIGLHRTDGQWQAVAVRVLCLEDFCQRLNFDRVAQRGAGPVGLDVGDLFWFQTARLQRLSD